MIWTEYNWVIWSDLTLDVNPVTRYYGDIWILVHGQHNYILNGSIIGPWGLIRDHE